MFRLPARTLRLLRLGAFSLLMLGLIVRPAVEQMGGIHELEHAVLAAADAGHGHEHANQEPASEPHPAEGLHGLMHEAECGVCAALESNWAMALDVVPAASPPLSKASSPRRGSPTTHFRPPIA